MDILLRQQLVCSAERLHNRTRYYGKSESLIGLSLLQMIYELLSECELTFKQNKCLLDLANQIIIKERDICHIRGESPFIYDDTNEIEILADINRAPTVDDTVLTLDENDLEIFFTQTNFTINFSDPDNDNPCLVRIVSLPSFGTLCYNNVPIEAGFIFLVENANLLSYKRLDNPYVTSFIFQTSDDNINNKLFSNMATFDLNVNGQVNQPPTIGDGSASTDYNTALTFTRAMFTTNTTPPYSDPEGDAPLTLKINTLPAQGQIRNNGVPISANDEFDFTTVIDAGLLTYHPDAGETNAHVPSFTFQIADAGSGQFVS